MSPSKRLRNTAPDDAPAPVRDSAPDPRAPAPGAPADPAPGSVGAALEVMLVAAELACAANTVRCYEQKAGHVLRLLGAQQLAALRIEHVESYCRQRLAEGAARESIRKELCVLRKALAQAARRGWLRGDPAALIPKFRAPYVPRKRWLSPEDFERLYADAPPKRRLWLLLAAYGGCRRSEVEGVRWEHVDLANQAMLVRGTKNRSSDRRVPMHPRLHEALRAIQQRPPVPDSSAPVVARWSNVRRYLALHCQQLGLARVSPNDLRRTFASWLVQAGVSSFVVSQLLGHTSSRMVELVYGRIDAATLRRAVAQLPEPPT